ncbi:hypothetical protein ACMSI6_14750 [Pseudomonas antarctica]|uniref:DUF4234 domain-containing protein n=1 Tax=Pseudomonas antarctica TaxID=219572 RepID=A0A1G9UPE8_9PSED|nr:hypothetical protein [Pseudomonas antarctica]KAF2408384.1 hypothetical protein PSAN_07770 [Pseudomonas antarctica]SDM61808.1 hypothetical protein SAMN04490179_0106 [Pseudomonas antarctica]
MSDNIYAPPTAELTETGKTSSEFYVISKTKLLVLSFLSFGLYTYIWSYKNWSVYKKAHQLDIWPLARAIFFIFFMHQLYRRADDRVARSGRKFDFDFEQWATVFVVVTVGARVFEMAANRIETWFAYKPLAILAVPLCAYILQQAQGLINFAAGDPEGQSNARFNLWNYLVIVPGAIMWCLTLMGLWAIYHR